MGTAWGATQPLSKIAVSTGHGHFGLIFWQTMIGALFLGAVTVLRRRRIPLTRATLRFAVTVALIGTIVPNSASYLAYARLPSGIMSILISAVPMLAFPIALALGTDRFSPARRGRSLPHRSPTSSPQRAFFGQWPFSANVFRPPSGRRSA